MDRDIILLLLGSVIGIIGTLIGTIVSQIFHRRAQRDQWAREDQTREREQLLEGVRGSINKTIPTRLRDPSGEYCFPHGTQITMGDRSKKPIESLSVGDMLLVYNHKTRCFSTTEVTNIIQAEASECYLLNNVLTITSSHLVYSGEYYIPTKKLQIGDSLFSEGGERMLLLSISLKTGRYEVFNLELKNESGFFAEGLLVGTFSSKVVEASHEELVEIDENGIVHQ